jgi:hypothetical protein
MTPLLQLADLWEKEARGYSSLAGVQEGSRPSDLTSTQHGLLHSAGTYRICAKALREMVKKLESKL